MNSAYSNPLVSVIMPIYNCKQYLEESIISILSQSFSNFEFIIIDDGSTDSSSEIINSFQDHRIRVFKFQKNIGIVDALNFGIEHSRGKYIMRMDGDDISHKDRMEAQVEYLEKHPEIDILGTWFMYLDNGEICKTPVTEYECLANMILGTVVGHPTMMLRKKSIDQHRIRYRKEYQFAEDYYFLYESIISNLKIQNIPHVLFYYRRHNGQISNTNSFQQIKLTKKIQLLCFHHLFNYSTLDFDPYFKALFEFDNETQIDYSYLYSLTPILISNLHDKRISKLVSEIIYEYLLKRNPVFRNENNELPFSFLTYLIFKSKLCHLQKIKEANIIRNVLLLYIFKIRYKILEIDSKIKKFIKILNRVNSFISNKISFKQFLFPNTIPIFINSYNRFYYLKNLINKLEQLNYKNIVIIDNNSTYQPLLNYYKTLPYEILYLSENQGHKAFWNTGLHKKYFNSFYVYTDPDIEPIGLCDKKFMRNFLNNLIRYPHIDKIGFGIITDDIPQEYKFKKEVLFSEKKYLNYPINSKLFYSKIDTTFALYSPGYDLYNKGESFYTSLRTSGKYRIRHLPWYELETENNEEYLHYYRTANESASWLWKEKSL
jgi:glycosyltransferase involved in cell wall biosynthesis